MFQLQISTRRTTTGLHGLVLTFKDKRANMTHTIGPILAQYRTEDDAESARRRIEDFCRRTHWKDVPDGIPLLRNEDAIAEKLKSTAYM